MELFITLHDEGVEILQYNLKNKHISILKGDLLQSIRCESQSAKDLA